ncbi:DUF4116 domain-containing protein [Rickettsiales bacterium]|nr:DUF4116 domain-containing protein [Rickettsiales bacterium]
MPVTDKDGALEVVSLDGLKFQSLPEDLKDDKETALAAVEQMFVYLNCYQKN